MAGAGRDMAEPEAGLAVDVDKDEPERRVRPHGEEAVARLVEVLDVRGAELREQQISVCV